jgi:hypothetical protein
MAVDMSLLKEALNHDAPQFLPIMAACVTQVTTALTMATLAEHCLSVWAINPFGGRTTQVAPQPQDTPAGRIVVSLLSGASLQVAPHIFVAGA